ncbi:MAG: hypothetical protein JNG84_05555, partial [Archangium sp.]|nr:hypothetical protein [Archangium sp.]
AVRGTAPTPAVVLRGEAGDDEAVYTTEAIRDASGGALSLELAAAVDAVIALAPLSTDELTVLARYLIDARGLEIPPETVAQLVALAERAGRGAHELASLISRLPPGRSTAR